MWAFDVGLSLDQGLFISDKICRGTRDAQCDCSVQGGNVVANTQIYVQTEAMTMRLLGKEEKDRMWVKDREMEEERRGERRREYGAGQDGQQKWVSGR